MLKSPNLLHNGVGPAPIRPGKEQPIRQNHPVAQENEEERNGRARRRRDQSIWFELIMFELIGWSIVGPILLGMLLGLWLDATNPTWFSWAALLFLLGLVIGCLHAWYWASRQHDRIVHMGKHDGRD